MERFIKMHLLDIKTIKHLMTSDSQMSHREVAKKLGLTRGEVWHAEDKAFKKIIKTINENKNLANALTEHLYDDRTY